MKELNKKIHLIRVSKKLSQAEMAEKLNINQGTYQKIEAGKTKLSEVRLQQIAKVFRMSPSEIVNWKIENSSQPIDAASEIINLKNEIELLTYKVNNFKTIIIMYYKNLLNEEIFKILSLIKERDKMERKCRSILLNDAYGKLFYDSGILPIEEYDQMIQNFLDKISYKYNTKNMDKDELMKFNKMLDQFKDED